MRKPVTSTTNFLGFSYQLRCLTLIATLGILAACSSSDNPDPVMDKAPPAVTSTSPQATATESQSGLAIDGPVSGAAVVVLESDGDQVATGTTDTTGRYSVEVPTNALYPLTVRATGGTDIVTNSTSTIRLSGIVEAADQPMVVTLFSTLAVRKAEECPAGLTEAQRRAARNTITNASVSALLNSAVSFGLNSTVREQLLSRIPTNSTQAASLLLSSEQLAESLRRTATAIGSTADLVLTALACDLADGTLNGSETGSTPRLAAVFQLVSAEVGLEAASGRLKVGGSNANAALNAALLSTFGGTGSVATLTTSIESLNQLRLVVNAALVASPSASLLQLYNALNGLVPPASPTSLAAIVDALSDPVPLRPVIDAPVTPSTTILNAIQTGLTPTPPVISLFTATPSLFGTSSGGSTTLQWAASNSTACERSGAGLGWNGIGAASGSIGAGPVVLNSTFTLTCSGPGGVTTANVTVLVPPSATISYAPTIAEPSQSVTVTITSLNTTSCNSTLTGGTAGTVSIVSGNSFSAEVGHGVSVSCTGPGGSVVTANSLPVRGAKLTWVAPTQTEDGTTATIEGFVVYHGPTPKSRSGTPIIITDPDTREISSAFPPGPRYIEITAISNGAFEGRYSNEVFKEIP